VWKVLKKGHSKVPETLTIERQEAAVEAHNLVAGEARLGRNLGHLLLLQHQGGRAVAHSWRCGDVKNGGFVGF
jgi:hypothetical protein